MRALGLLGLLALGIGSQSPAAAAEGEAARARRLVAQLGSDHFREREEAGRALGELGALAVLPLQQALASPDLEVRRRARELLPRIELRLVQERGLTPRRVRLRCKDLPVTAAVALLAKESGQEVVLYDPGHALKDKKVTLDTGMTTYWDALDQLCAAAGLIDWDPTSGTPGTGLESPAKPTPAGTPPPADPGPPGFPGGGFPGGGFPGAPPGGAPAPGGFGGVPGGGFPGGGFAPGGFPGGMPAGGFPGAMAPYGYGFPGPGGVLTAFGPGQSVLVPAKPTRVPADTSTSVRVRFSRFDVFGPTGKDEERVLLQITPEARLQWLQAAEVKVTEALDDRGQKRTAAASPVPLSPYSPYMGSTVPLGGMPWGGGFPGAPVPGGWAVAGGPGFPAMPDMVGSPYMTFSATGLDMAGGASHRYTRLVIAKAAKPAAKLKVLRGTIKAWVRLENEELLTIDDLLAVKGKTRAGKYGVAVKVTEVTRAAGRVTVTFRLEKPETVEPDMSVMSTPLAAETGTTGPAGGSPPLPPDAPPGPIPLPGMAGPGGMTPVAAPAQGFQLHDHSGKALPANIVLQGQDATDPTILCYQVQYVAPKGATAEPVKLTFRGRRSALLEIPFALKDVPLR